MALSRKIKKGDVYLINLDPIIGALEKNKIKQIEQAILIHLGISY